MKTVKSILIGFLIFLAFGISHAKVYTVGVENIDLFPYFTYNKKTKEYKGAMRDLFDAYARSKGIKFVYKAYPLNRLFKYFLDGKFDIKAPSNPEWRADEKKSSGKNFTYTIKMIPFQDALIRKLTNFGKPMKVISIVRGFTPWLIYNDVKSGKYKTRESKNMISVLSQVGLGRTDAGLVNVIQAKYLLKNDNKLKKFALDVDKSQPIASAAYHCSTINHPNLIKDFNKFIKKNKDIIRKIRDSYGISSKNWPIN
ncbi:transporter substrate-binding domain-containing protein [Bacteriovoracales bacterium]|nr:transporter substrate-binding domain-containing protein [Bacteriovoracales bacterium]